MTLHSRVALPIRNQIAKRYSIWCAAATGVLIIALLLSLWLDASSYILYLFACVTGFAGLFAIELWVYRNRMLRFFKPGVEDSLLRFDQYLSRKLEKWEHDHMQRIVIGVVLTFMMIFFLFFRDDKRGVSITAFILISFILYSMLKSWNNFLDQILLQDFRRSQRDQPPDMST